MGDETVTPCTREENIPFGSGNLHPGVGSVGIWLFDSVENSGLQEAKHMSQLEAKPSLQHS